MNNISLLSTIELIHFNNVNLPDFKIKSIQNNIFLKKDKVFDSISFIQRSASFKESANLKKGGVIYNRTISFDIAGVNFENDKILEKYMNQKLVCKITDINGVKRLVYPAYLQFESKIDGNVKKTNRYSCKIISKSLFSSPFIS